jgi:hypothetical protein
VAGVVWSFPTQVLEAVGSTGLPADALRVPAEAEAHRVSAMAAAAKC